MRTREVFCVIDSQGVELEVDDSNCNETKPASEEACGNQPCPAEWYTVHIGQVNRRQLIFSVVRNHDSFRFYYKGFVCSGELFKASY